MDMIDTTLPKCFWYNAQMTVYRHDIVKERKEF